MAFRRRRRSIRGRSRRSIGGRRRRFGRSRRSRPMRIGIRM